MTEFAGALDGPVVLDARQMPATLLAATRLGDWARRSSRSSRLGPESAGRHRGSRATSSSPTLSCKSS